MPAEFSIKIITYAYFLARGSVSSGYPDFRYKSYKREEEIEDCYQIGRNIQSFFLSKLEYCVLCKVEYTNSQKNVPSPHVKTKLDYLSGLF